MLFRRLARKRRNDVNWELEILSGDLLWFGVALVASPFIAMFIGYVLNL